MSVLLLLGFHFILLSLALKSGSAADGVNVDFVYTYSGVSHGLPVMENVRCFTGTTHQRVIAAATGLKFWGPGGFLVNSTAEYENGYPPDLESLPPRTIIDFGPLGKSPIAPLIGTFTVEQETIACNEFEEVSRILMSFSPPYSWDFNQSLPNGSFLWDFYSSPTNDSICWKESINTRLTRVNNIPPLQWNPKTIQLFLLGHKGLMDHGAVRIAQALSNPDDEDIVFEGYAADDGFDYQPSCTLPICSPSC